MFMFQMRVHLVYPMIKLFGLFMDFYLWEANFIYFKVKVAQPIVNISFIVFLHSTEFIKVYINASEN